MRSLIIEKVPDDLYRALQERAQKRQHTVEAEVREILVAAVRQEAGPGLGTALAAIGRELGFTEADIDYINSLRDRTPYEPPDFS